MIKFKTFSYLSILIIFLSTVSCNTPETYVYLGHQVPKKYLEEIQELKLLNNSEKIKYFYSDGLNDIKEGFYLVTDQHLVLYAEEWEQPSMILEFEDILSLDAEFDDSWLYDSFIILTTDNYEVEFPVSSEKGRDRLFYEYLKEKTQLNL